MSIASPQILLGYWIPPVLILLTCLALACERRDNKASRELPGDAAGYSVSSLATTISNTVFIAPPQPHQQTGITGYVPDSRPKPLVAHQYVWLSTGRSNYCADDLLWSAIEYVKKTEPAVDTSKLRADVFFELPATGALGRVVLGQSIGRVSWSITIDEHFRVIKVIKGNGSG